MKVSGSIYFAVAAMLSAIGGSVAIAQVQLNIQTGVQVSWPTSTNDTYHLQASSNPVTTWTDFVAAVAGNGLTNSVFDPVPVGTRSYQVLEIIPGTPASSSSPTNGGFEIAGTGSNAANWVVDTAAGGPVYGVRSSDSPHSGSFNFQVHLASTGAGPVVQFNQAGVPVTGGTVYPFIFAAKALAGSQGQSTQWRILWNAGGDTGYQTFNLPTAGSPYTVFTNSVTAPASATSATIFFHFAGAAISAQSANIDIDDVVLGSGSSSPGSPTVTNVLQVATLSLATVTWPSANGVQYFPQILNDQVGAWTDSLPAIVGDGGTKSITLPMTNNATFVRLRTPPTVVLPPTNLHQVPSGSTNAIGVAWTASASPGVTGYRMLYGDIATTITNTLDLGNVTSTIISSLTSGQTYFVSIITLSPNGQSQPTDATITAQPDSSIGVVPLFSAFTTLEPDTVYDTPSNHVTRIADRPRGRHGREDGTHDSPPRFDFGLYDTYLIFYWEQRMTTIEIDDYIAKGGSNVFFHMWSLNGLDTPNIRFFFQGATTVAQYFDNEFATQADASLTNWTWNLTHNYVYNRPLQAGDKVEIEFSPFMVTVTNGQNNYYGGVILYVVGQGIVPWTARLDPIHLAPADDGPFGPGGGSYSDSNGVTYLIDSYPIASNGWLAGTSTMPYQYSGEPTHLFNQLSPGASPPTGQPFVLGRRLHHTDFGDGSHSEAGNPIYAEQVGKLGPKFTNRSCVSCHVHNGRALPPAIGAPMLQSVVHVASDASGTPDPVFGSVLQPQITSGTPEGSCVISSYTTNSGTYGDSTPYTLVKPNYTFSPHTPAFYSVRVAPQLVGLGLLEAISESSIEALSDPSDGDSDGISGRIRTVTDPVTGDLRLGRFTYRGGQALVMHQIASALKNDMGVTTSVFPVLDGDVSSGPVELSDNDLTNWTRYVQALGVNARRDLTNSAAIQGEALFGSASCWKCHTPTFTTSPYHPMAELRNQKIHPYTDLLLHDMGPGLADNLGEGNATGSEWRTPPLWSIGLTPGISGGEAYLHDGRARSLEEAILWHDGEGAASREAFRNMSASDRAALIAFLKSL